MSRSVGYRAVRRSQECECQAAGICLARLTGLFSIWTMQVRLDRVAAAVPESLMDQLRDVGFGKFELNDT